MDQDDGGGGAAAAKSKQSSLDQTALIPRHQHFFIQSTEMVSARDAYVPLSLTHVAHVMQLTSMCNATSLLALLQRLSRLSSSVFTAGAGSKPPPVLPPKGNIKSVEKLPQASLLGAPAAGPSNQDPPISSNLPSTGDGDTDAENPALELTMIMSHIRSLLVQLATAECLQGEEKVQHLMLLQTILARDLHPLISIALLDPVNSVVQAFQKATAEQQQAEGSSDSPSTGQQLDVLSNLLREGDICFLEKISLRVWRHFHSGDGSADESCTNKTAVKNNSARHQPTPLSGEVQILGNRIRALSHFPSVKIFPVSLEKMSGRWFYECTLLSDGLMQIGWADRSFRSDPVCGQGVGDHLHSWAVDGLRTKKWNVSCESYGSRWKVEDVVGVLVDMDLLEMKFFINGVDMGPAFTNFQAVGLFPAVSLNVRQCLRVNFGQELFMFPPDVVDRLPYRPVRDALHWKSPQPLPPKSNDQEKALRGGPSTAGSESKPVERVVIMQAESANPGNISARVGSAVPGRRPSRGGVTDGTRSAGSGGVNNSTSEEEAARHAALVLSAASAQGATVAVAGAQLEESVDERQIRENVHAENSEVSSETNTWAEMGQNLSRRGSRNSLSPRAIASATANASSGAIASVSATVDSTGMSDTTQRLLLQTTSATGDSAANKDGSDDDDEDDDEKEDDEEDGQAVMRFFQQQQRHERRAEMRGTSTEVEARRQQLIENLIGMGFPIDWSLRAAEHCDANVSESVAIAWIIERMELEHAKMEEMDGGEDSRRMVEELEESDEQSQGLAGLGGEEEATTSAQHRASYGFHGMHDSTGEEKEDTTSSAGVGGGSATLLKPTPKPPLGARVGGGTVAGGVAAGTTGSAHLRSSSKVNQLNHDMFTGSACSTGGYQEQGTWNNEHLPYASLLVGQESARRRFDMDKQAVLSQISELDFCDLFPIVLSCQFSLCIFYARCTFIRIFRLICSTLKDVASTSPNDTHTRAGAGAGSASSNLKGGSTKMPEDCGAVLHVLGENFLKILLETPADAPGGSTSLSSLVNLLEICFKQGQGAANQPDKLFPSLLQGTTAGDPIDTCPTVAPFTSHNSRTLTQTLSMLELAVFAYYEDSRVGYRAPKVISTISMEEASLQSSSLVMSFLRLITERSYRVNMVVSPPRDSTLTAANTATSTVGRGGVRAVDGQRRLQERLVTSLCAEMHVQRLGLTDKSTCTQLLKTVLSTCVTAFEMAAGETYDRKDWISSGSERSLQEPSQGSEKLNITEDVSHRPYIFWAFTTMASMLQIARSCELESPLEHVADILRTLHSPDRIQYDPIEELSSPQMMSRLIGLANSSANASFNFCIFSLCNELLNRANRKLATVNALLHDPHAQFQLQVMTDTDTVDASRGSLPIVPLLRQWEKQLLRQTQGFHTALTTMLYPPPSVSKTTGSHFQQFPNHTLGGFTTEYKVLRICSGRLLTESPHYRINSRYTRKLFQLLLEVSALQRRVLSAPKTKDRDAFVTSVLHEDVVNDWRTAHSIHAASTAGTSLSSSPTASGGKEVPMPTLTVAHVTSTSMHITWTNVPEDEDWNTAVQRAAGAAIGGSGTSPGVGGTNAGSGSGISLSASVGGLLASIKGTLSYSQPNHTSFSLYITPLYRSVEKGASSTVGQLKDLRSSQEAEPTLIMPFVTPHGSHKVDLLDPDTLYKVSLVSDEEPSSSSASPLESPAKQPTKNGKGSFTSWGTSLLRGGKKEPPPSQLLMSATGPTKTNSTLEEDQSTGSKGESPTNSDRVKHDAARQNEEEADVKESEGNTQIDPAQAKKHTSTNPFEHQIAVVVSTLAEPLFLLDGTVGFCPPQLKVTHHGLTVRNTINKKWSTVRATTRLTSGVHQWEIYIDRCISKNIFLGVVSPEARTDNYVGCDKHGWAFLANRAVWFNKGKLKSYGELFRTGDVVQVTLDLDSGGSMSFSINGKDLGVAVEGLSGPLYPAFSLYNEDDQISVSPPRQPLFLCDNDDSVSTSSANSNMARVESALAKMAYDVDGITEGRKGNAGTANAERVVQRLDTLQNMLRFIAASRNYRGCGVAKSTSGPVFQAKQFLVPSVVTELALRWSLWRQSTTLRSVRVKNGEVMTLLMSSLLCLGMSDHRYCPGDLIQWEQHQFVVLGVGRHRLWIQQTSGNGEVIGFTKESLHTLHVKNAIRLVKKRSTLHRMRSDKVKTTFTPTVLPKSVSTASNESGSVRVAEENGDGEEKDQSPTTSDRTSQCAVDGYTEAELEHPSVLCDALLGDADTWTHAEDSCLLEWLELRARMLGSHPLNLNLDQITSPAGVVEHLHELGYSDDHATTERMGLLGDSSATSSHSGVKEFMLRFKPLARKSLISIRLRALLLLHLNDTLSPLLSLVYEPDTVDDPSPSRPDTKKPPALDLMSPLNTMLLAHRHVILLEVKFSFGFRLGWATMMSPCMLEGGGNHVATMTQKKAAFMERDNQSFADIESSPAPPAAVNQNEISFSACPTELPILPYRPVPGRESSAHHEGRPAGESVATTVRAFNALNNPLHPSNAAASGGRRTLSSSKSEAQSVSATKSSQSSDGQPEDATHLQRLSVYFFQDAASSFLNWTTYGLSIPSTLSSTGTASAASLPPLSGSSSILGLPVINMFVAEPQRLRRGVVEYANKTQLQQLFEQDFRWRLLSNFQSSLLGQLMQTLERLEVQQQSSSKLASGTGAGPDGDAATTAAGQTSFLTPITPEGPWDRIVRSVFRGGMFWEEHMSPSSRPVSVYVHFVPPPTPPSSSAEASKKEGRGRKDRLTSSGAMDSARSGATLTPRLPTASSGNTNTLTTTDMSVEVTSATDTDGDREKEREELLRSLSLLPPAAGLQVANGGSVPGGGVLLDSRLQRVFHLLQTNPALLAEGVPAGLISPWGLLQVYIVEAVAEVQPLLASPLLASELDFYSMGDAQLTVLAKSDVLGHYLAQQARFGEMRHEESSSALAGVVNLHLHIMHSLGVLLGVALRHGITPNIRMSSYFWKVLSKSYVNPYSSSSSASTSSFENAGAMPDPKLQGHGQAQAQGQAQGGRRGGKAGRRLQELLSGVRESCARTLRHGVAAVLPENFLDLLQEQELRTLLAGGGATVIENLRATVSYSKPVQESDLHVEMFWTALSDLPKSSVVRLLQGLWAQGGVASNSAAPASIDPVEREKGLPNELFYWKNTSSPLGTLVIADPPPSPKGSSTLPQGTSTDGHFIHMKEQVVYLPRYSSADVMRIKLQSFINDM